MLVLARKIVRGDEEDAEAETLEMAFAQARDAEASAEELLVDDGWKAVESLSRTGAVNGNGHRNAIGPTVELIPSNGHTPASVNGKGHYDDAEELVSRKSKFQSATLSMFEWALRLEQERG